MSNLTLLTLILLPPSFFSLLLSLFHTVLLGVVLWLLFPLLGVVSCLLFPLCLSSPSQHASLDEPLSLSCWGDLRSHCSFLLLVSSLPKHSSNTYYQFCYNRQLKQNVHLSKIKVHGISHLHMYHMVNITLKLPFVKLQVPVTLQVQKHTIEPYSSFENIFPDISRQFVE